MKTKIVIEIESADKLMGTTEAGGADEGIVEVNIAKDFHEEVITEIKRCVENWKTDFPETIEEYYIEGYDEMKSYELKVTLSQE